MQRTQVSVRPPGWVGQEAAAAFAALLRWSERAEALGLDGVFVGDRMLPQAANRQGVVYGATMVDAGVALAAIAARTARIRLGPLVLVLPFRHPIQLAKLTASLDVASGGRLVLGVGAGWNPPEFRALGIPRDERGARFEESLRILRELWAGERSSADRFWSFSDVALAPLPLQPGGPPVWMASFSPGSALDWETDVPPAFLPVLQRIGRLADGWVPLIYSASHRRRLDPRVLGAAWRHVLTAAEGAGRSRNDIDFVLSDWVYVLDGPASVRRCQEALTPFFAGDWGDARRTYNIGTAAEVADQLYAMGRQVDRVDSYVLTPLSDETEQLVALAQAVAPRLRIT
jgi:alkanesulfonate monooxygenase SsuD/methylene tetrahydromethanopterin reductase-like flavin-dependent oxidoreductase (luciferase family)